MVWLGKTSSSALLWSKTSLVLWQGNVGNDDYSKQCPKSFGDVYTPVPTVAARSRLRSASACVVRQSGTNFHRICEAQTLENSLSVALVALAIRVCVRQEACLTDAEWRRAVQVDLLTSTYLLKQDGFSIKGRPPASAEQNTQTRLFAPVTMALTWWPDDSADLSAYQKWTF